MRLLSVQLTCFAVLSVTCSASTFRNGACVRHGDLCKNGGTCSETARGVECLCVNGFVGSLCERNVDDCLSNHCEAGSTCVDGIAKYTCVCPPGKIGLFCHLDDPCVGQPCKESSECIADAASGHFSCICKPGFTGRDCSVDIDECQMEKDVCMNGGTCVNTRGSWFCECAPGFSGIMCMVPEERCVPNPCLHQGTCLNFEFSFKCACASGFYGTRCEFECPVGFEGERCELRVDVQKFADSDDAQRQACGERGCARKATDGFCDDECNFYACDYDGGDCSVRTRPFARCGAPSYCAHVFRDNKCDSLCDNEGCLFDGFDCVTPFEKCPSEKFCANRYRNGRCDPECNNENCLWDGGDCSTTLPPHLLPGELALIVLIPPAEFLRRVSSFLFALSAKLRVLVRIRIVEGRLAVFPWNFGNSTAHKDLISFDVSAPSSTVASEEEPQADGTLVFLAVDASHCSSEGPSSDADCFSDVAGIADYLGAASAKQALASLGMPVYAARAETPHAEEPFRHRGWPAILIAVGIVTLLVSVAVCVLHGKRRHGAEKTLHTLGTWFPAKFGGQAMFVPNAEAEVCLPCVTTKRPWPKSASVGPTALHDHASSSDAVPLPIDSRVVDARDKYGRTALMLTARNHAKTEAVSVHDVDCLLKAGADVNARDERYDTALVYAIRAQRHLVMRHLIDRGADCVTSGIDGRTPLHYAVAEDDVETVRMLIPAYNSEQVDSVDDNNCTPLMKCAQMSLVDSEVAEALLKAGANPSFAGDCASPRYTGYTAMHFAAQCGNLAMVHCLAEHEQQQRRQNGETKLVDAEDYFNRTPLYLAASEGNTDVVQWLVSYGANTDVRDSEGRSAADIARANNYDDVVKYLEKHSDMGSAQRDKASPRKAAKKTKRAFVQKIRPSPQLESSLDPLTPPKSDLSSFSGASTSTCHDGPLTPRSSQRADLDVRQSDVETHQPSSSSDAEPLAEIPPALPSLIISPLSEVHSDGSFSPPSSSYLPGWDESPVWRPRHAHDVQSSPVDDPEGGHGPPSPFTFQVYSTYEHFV